MEELFVCNKSYMFKNKDPVLDIIRTAVQDSGSSYQEIRDKSGVSTATLGHWFKGKTRRPQFATVNAVARALGQEFRLTKCS